MTNPKIYKWIKTACVQAMYKQLESQKGVLARIRLYWFIFFAVLRDWNLPNSDQIDDSES